MITFEEGKGMKGVKNHWIIWNNKEQKKTRGNNKNQNDYFHRDKNLFSVPVYNV